MPDCIMCDSTKLKNWGVGFYKCGQCEIVFRKKMPTSEELDSIYVSYYSKDKLNNNNTNMVSNNISLINHANYIQKYIKKGAKILEFGAGTGGLINILKDMGYEVDGVEFSDQARDEARSRYNIEMFKSTDDVVGDKYDLIIAMEVIEHLINPMHVFKEVGSKLKHGGKIYITTPNSNGLQARLFMDNWREAEKPFHLVFFNYASLVNMFKNIGGYETKYLRYSPITTNSVIKKTMHRALQFLGLYGGLRVMINKV